MGATTYLDRLAALAAWAVSMALGLTLYRLTHIPETGLYHLNDDQMITMRVAYMIATEGVPYYNSDEAVAANTSLFWPYMLSPLFTFGLGLERAVHTLFILSTAAYCTVAVWVAWQLQDWLARASVVLFLVLSGSALNYAGSGWEHVPQTVFTTIGLVVLLRDPTLGNLTVAFYAFAAAFLMRPDVALIIAYLFLAGVGILSGRERTRFILICLPALLFPAAYLGGMFAAYGDVVPNTWYLKRPDGGDTLLEGLRYVVDPRRSGLVPLFFLISLVFWHRVGAGGRLVLGAIAIQLAYTIWVGGDFSRAGRFFLFLLPVATLIVVSRFAAIGKVRLILAAACLAGAASLYDTQDRVVRWTREHLVSQLGLIALIKEAVPPAEGSIGLHTLGLGYHLPEHHIVDFLGKADPVIARSQRRWGIVAHDKWDYEHSFSSSPIAAIPVHHGTLRRVERAPDADYETERHTYMAPMAAFALRSGDYVYLAPRDLCRGGSFGLLVRPLLAPPLIEAACN